MTKSKAKEIIEQTKGRFMTIKFVKKDATIRTMNCRLGVKKYLHGGKSNVDQNDYVTVYDLNAKGYRSVNLSTVQEIHYKKVWK
jgi:hypothetical protein